jgi:hypothetical protein
VTDATSSSTAASTNAVARSDNASSSQQTQSATPEAAAATKAIEDSRQGGVVNPGELSKEVVKAYERDPKEGAALQAELEKQLSPRDQTSLNEQVSATLGAVAGARGAQPDTVPAYRVEGQGNERMRIAPNGNVDIPTVNTNKGRGPERNLYVNFDDPARARAFQDQRLQQFPDNVIKSVEVPRSYLNELRATAVPESQRASAPDRPVIADPTKARDQFGLSGQQIDRLRDVAVPGSGRDNVRPSALANTVGVAKQGALVGAATDAALSTASALRDGRITGDEAKDIVANSARGAVVGGTYAVTEQGLVRLADRTVGPAMHNAAAATAARFGATDAVAVGAATRTVATRLSGAGAAGAVVSAGFSIYANRDGLARGDSQAVGRVAGDVAVGASAALSGAAAGAAIGSFVPVPVVGTVVGAVVGLGVGFAADYVMRAGGVDKAIGNAVSSGVDAVKGAASTVAGWLGW